MANLKLPSVTDSSEQLLRGVFVGLRQRQDSFRLVFDPGQRNNKFLWNFPVIQ